ncbi:MAG: phenylacetate-CoA oxygenase subunit PaaC [Bacteroidetes bacterium]|jgi:ring-1,2-phenylacetyl-CoA epoxidase subunit PaaC|nr:phenylacetate-CoA oxygenase subunit PaaC [Bacteroidota bacterium]HQW45558.1 phenylacetate-CoA oxygenase subunit PaaC [Chitinophagaceae bacterium]MBK7040977.1 phenylacetate-CoA oxygenase subunit PaaC [Bacteroidota bacterium]MBK7587866.1 phenylacetate-CoA oxygenase subunit PaaC [Bacteroidota bacterium]MBK8328940.1 phenylacetate-CoA oxygenase subunit PaaC [Bacteroidota bacterium]
MTKQQALYKYLLRLGDNPLILGHRLSEWCSRGPILEEDLALTNIALDNIGRAQAFLKYAAEVEGLGKTADDLAYKRDERSFYNNLIAELPIGDFAYTIARQLLIAVFEQLQFTDLSKSSNETIAGIAAKSLKEVRYHVAHARDWCYRLGKGTEESHNRLQRAFNELWMYTGELFEMYDEDVILVFDGVAGDLNTLKIQYYDAVQKILNDSNIQIPVVDYMQTGSRKGIHTEYLGHILAEMQYLQRAYPDATW